MTSEQIERLQKLELSEGERNLLAAGICPKCKRSIRGNFDPVGKCHFLAPEIYETLRENNIDADSGHENNCELKGIRLN